MKVTIKNENKSSEIKYPCLMQSKQRTLILFATDGAGTVIKGESYKTGTYSDLWDMSHFTPFTGTIELSND